MQKLFKPIINDKITYWGFIISSLFLVLGFGAILSFFRFLPTYFPIYNKFAWGYSRVGSRWEIFVPFTITFVILVSNLFVSANIYQKVPLLARILCATTIGASVLFFIFIVQLVYLIK